MVRRRGILRSAARTAGRTAVIAGTATAVSQRVANRQRGTLAHPQPQAPTNRGALHESAPGEATDLVGRLHQLADLKAMGALTEKEFAAAKTRLLKD